MYTRNKTTEAIMPGQMWHTLATPRFRILQELATKLISEVETITDASTRIPPPIHFDDGFKLYDQLQRFESDMIRLALYLSGGRQNKAARLLGIKSTTLNAKIKRLQLKDFLLTPELESEKKGGK